MVKYGEGKVTYSTPIFKSAVKKNCWFTTGLIPHFYLSITLKPLLDQLLFFNIAFSLTSLCIRFFFTCNNYSSLQLIPQGYRQKKIHDIKQASRHALLVLFLCHPALYIYKKKYQDFFFKHHFCRHQDAVKQKRAWNLVNLFTPFIGNFGICSISVQIK